MLTDSTKPNWRARIIASLAMVLPVVGGLWFFKAANGATKPPIVIDRFYPSSKMHNGCGGYNDDLQLADRVWVCPVCGAQVDRDLNAARNLKSLARASGEVTPVQTPSGVVEAGTTR